MTVDKFITHINTKFFFTYNLKNVEERTPVKKNAKGLANLLGNDFEAVLNKLVNEGRITFKRYGDFYHIKPTEQGAIDITSINANEQPTDTLHSTIRDTLKRVSLKEGSASTLFFDLFLRHKNQYLNHFFNVDKFVGRIHSPVSNLHRTIRPYLLIDGQSTAHIDINTAQPLFLARTLNEVIGKNEFTSWVYSDKDVYLELLAKSDLPDRDTAKKKFLKTLFHHDLTEITNLYGNSPWAEWITWYKSVPEPRNKKTKDWNTNPYYNNLAWLLQKIEVQTMRKVWKELAAVNIPFLTVHDSVIIKQTDHAQALEIFHSVMKSEFTFYKIHSEGMLEVEQNEALPTMAIEAPEIIEDPIAEDAVAPIKTADLWDLPNFDNMNIPETLILNAGAKIMNVQACIKSHLSTINANLGNKAYFPYLQRLNAIHEILIKQSA